MYKKDCVEWTMQCDSWRSPQDAKNDDMYEPPPICNPDTFDRGCADDKFRCLKVSATKMFVKTNIGPGRCTCS